MAKTPEPDASWEDTMFKRRDVLKTGFVAAATLSAPALVFGQAKKTMRLSHPLPVAHHNAKAMQIFADEAKAFSKGEIEVQIFPAEQAAKANENHPQVARGGVSVGQHHPGDEHNRGALPVDRPCQTQEIPNL
jgi:TRAP-type C4-dicarboxylate transport system substrate-binding protein